MLKAKNFLILIIIYVIAFISIKTNINLFYPYYLIKDLVFFPVSAEDNDLKLNKNVIDGINLEHEKEFIELKNINNLSSTLTDFSPVTGVVIERNKMYWFNTITINKGESSGIKEDMAVVSSDGLIGRVNKVSKLTSEIKLITTNDVNSKISVMIKNNDDIIYGILSGYDSSNNYLQVTMTNKDIDNLSNSLVYTSGMGGVFPSGILIGKVANVIKDKYDVSKIIQVEPSSNFNDFRFVSVLKRN